MRTTTRLHRSRALVGVLLGLVLWPAAAGAQATTQHNDRAESVVQSAERPSLSASALIGARHASDSIQAVLATIASVKATDPDVRRLAQTLMFDHVRMFNDLADLVPRVSGVLNARSRRDDPLGRFRRMRAGPGFDAAFVTAIVEAHRTQLQQSAGSAALDAPLREFFDLTRPVLERHVRLAEALLTAMQR